MKQTSVKIGIIALAGLMATAFAACTKVEASQGGDIDYTKPILLSQQLQAELDGTKSLAENNDMRNESFGVLGYQYNVAGIGGSDGTWLTNRAQAKVNVFATTTGGTTYKVPEIVSCSDAGVCSYTPLQYWDKQKNYAFFAYYPTGLAVKDENGGTYSTSTMGAPYVEYSVVSSGTTFNNFSQMQDVLTAYSIDRNVKDGRNVNLNFQHRLFCIAVKALNMENVPVTISKLDVKISGIDNQSVRLALDRSLDDKLTKFGQKQSPTFNVINTTAEAYTIPQGEKHTVSGSNNIMLIPPQRVNDNNAHNGNISMKYTKGTGSEVTVNNISITNIDRVDFEAGRKYYLNITFSGDGVFVELVTSPRWTDAPVDIEFE